MIKQHLDTLWDIPISYFAPDEDMELLSEYCYDYRTLRAYESTRERNISVAWSSYVHSFEDVSAEYVGKCQNITMEDDDDHLLVIFHNWVRIGVPKVVALLCNQTYSLSTRETILDWVDGSLSGVMSVSTEVTEMLPVTVKPFQISAAVLEVANYDYVEMFEDSYGLRPRTWWNAINLTAGWDNIDNYNTFNSTYLRDLFIKTYKTYVSRAAKLNWIEKSNKTLDGRMEYETVRIVVDENFLITSECILGCLGAVAFTLLIFHLKRYLRSPASLASLAVSLSRSRDLELLLEGARKHKQDFWETCFRRHKFSTAGEANISMKEETLKQPSQRNDTTLTYSLVDNHKDWWRPLALSVRFQIFIIAFSVSIIILLEVLYQYSRTHDGITIYESSTRYWWVLLPIVVLMLLGLGYTSIDNAVRVLQPYHRLEQQKPRSIDALMFNPLGEISILVLYRSIMCRDTVLTLGVSATILSSLLTAIASGLYTTQATASTNQGITLAVNQWFDLRSADTSVASEWTTGSVADSDAYYPMVNEAIQFFNMSYPPGTYREFVFASLSKDSAMIDNTTLRARLPAVRSRANCTVLDDGASRPYTIFRDGNRLPLIIRPPPGCKIPPSIAAELNTTSESPQLVLTSMINDTISHTLQGFDLVDNDAQGMCTAAWTVPSIPMGVSLNDSSYTRPLPTNVCDDGGLQHLFFLTGISADSSNILTFNVLHCMPYVEALFVDASFTLPDLKIIVDKANPPPAPVEDSARVWDETHRVHSTSQFPNLLDIQGMSVNHGFFWVYLGTAVNAVPFSELSDPENTASTMNRLSEVYSQLTAQLIHEKYRTKPGTAPNILSSGPSGSFVSSPVQAEVFVYSQRVVQSLILTRILQVVLLIMTACAITVFFYTRKRTRLPVDPASLAARLSFFVNSELVRITKANDVRDVVMFEKLFEDKTFSMGWWYRPSKEPSKEIQKRFGIDICGNGWELCDSSSLDKS
jgi:hypothetical protein